MINIRQTSNKRDKGRKYKGKLEYKGEPKTNYAFNLEDFTEPPQVTNRFSYTLEAQDGLVYYNFIADTKEEVDKKIKIAEPLMDLVEEISWIRFKIEREYAKTIIGYPLIREWEEEKKQLQHKLTKLINENNFIFKVENGMRANTYILEDKR